LYTNAFRSVDIFLSAEIIKGCDPLFGNRVFLLHRYIGRSNFRG